MCVHAMISSRALTSDWRAKDMALITAVVRDSAIWRSGPDRVVSLLPLCGSQAQQVMVVVVSYFPSSLDVRCTFRVNMWPVL